MLEVLDGLFVLSRGFQGIECAEVAATLGPGIDFPRIDAILSRFQFADHNVDFFENIQCMNADAYDEPRRNGVPCSSFRFID